MSMQPKIIFEPHIPMALHHALEYAGDDGFVASLPELLHARTNAPYDNLVWNTWFTAHSEECVVTSPQGNPVVVAIHGGGVLGTPQRFERSLQPGEFPRPLTRTEVSAFPPSSEAYCHGSLCADMDHRNAEGLTGDGAAKVTSQEARDVLDGKLPDGTRIPISGSIQRPGAVVPWSTSGAGPQAGPKAPAVGHFQQKRTMG